jgi:hypothetical protein
VQLRLQLPAAPNARERWSFCMSQPPATLSPGTARAVRPEAHLPYEHMFWRRLHISLRPGAVHRALDLVRALLLLDPPPYDWASELDWPHGPAESRTLESPMSSHGHRRQPRAQRVRSAAGRSSSARSTVSVRLCRRSDHDPQAARWISTRWVAEAGRLTMPRSGQAARPAPGLLWSPGDTGQRRRHGPDQTVQKCNASGSS